MISLINWNIRGISDDTSFKRLHSLRKQFKSCFISIQEPLVSNKKQKRICRKLGFAGYTSNCENKIWVMWTSDVSVRVLEDHPQYLHVELIHTCYPDPIQISCVYAKCGRKARAPLWDGLSALNVGDVPWLCVGDFNVISGVHEQV